MHIPINRTRSAFSRHAGDGESHSADEQQEEAFARLFKTAAPVTDNHQDAEARSGSGKKVPFTEGPASLLWQQFLGIGGMSATHWLAWRLTNGPLAGLEIEARSQDGQIIIRLAAADLEKLQRRAGKEPLERTLARQFACRVIIEVNNDENSTDQ
jgi:heme exporter protein D